MYSCVAGAGLDMGTEFLDIITPDEAASLVGDTATMYIQYHMRFFLYIDVSFCWNGSVSIWREVSVVSHTSPTITGFYSCEYTHGDLCELCNKECLSPFDPEQRKGSR